MRGATTVKAVGGNVNLFQSTRPVRGATEKDPALFKLSIFQSTRPVRGATGRISLANSAATFQSTRPVRGATLHHAAPPSDPLFQSTRPVRGATSNSPHLKTPKTISIHAPRAGRDTARLPPICSASNFNPRAPCGARRRPAPKAPKQTRHFNPRAPCGARPSFITPSSQQSLFQSTRPVRGATNP